jgi:hypothetical protein
MTTNKTFTFEYDGKEYTIPSIAALTSGVLRKTRKIEDELDKTYTILEELLGEDSEALAALDKMDIPEFSEWATKWTQGVSLGESSGSENS